MYLFTVIGRQHTHILLFQPLPQTPFPDPDVWGPGMFTVLDRCCLMHDKYNRRLHSCHFHRPSAQRRFPPSCQLLLSGCEISKEPGPLCVSINFPSAHLISIAESLGRGLMSCCFGVGPPVAYRTSANPESDPQQNPLAGSSGGSEPCGGAMHM